MRKTRLVILPTKCLHQMGFLLLFLSCPVIGDWGRIRPESENSHKAIQIEREGSCGLQRDPPGGLLDVLNENGPKQCRLGEDYEFKTAAQQPVYERRVDVGRMSQRRDVRAPQRTIRSRSVEIRTFRARTLERKERARSLSLSRLENERTVRAEGNSHREAEAHSRRLSLSRRTNERRDERRVEERRLQREIRNDRREQNTRSLRSTDAERMKGAAERRQSRVERNERLATRRENDVTRRLARERTQREVRERTDRRLSLTRMEQDNSRRTERLEDRRTSERRSPEVRAARRTRSLEREETARTNENADSRREIDNRRLSALSAKRMTSERRTERLDALRVSRTRLETKPRATNDDPDLDKEKDEALLGGVTKWMDLKSYETSKIGDWTTNCVVGAVAYFLTSRQVKTV